MREPMSEEARSLRRRVARLEADKRDLWRRFMAEKAALQAALRHRLAIRDIDDHPYPCADCEAAEALAGFVETYEEEDED